MAIRVLLADDHTLVRAGIHALIHNFEGVEVVAEASDGREALKLVSEHLPDVVMADVGMPGLNGIEITARLSKEHPQVRVLILSMHASEEYVLQALRAGAAGYLVKGADPTELELAIRAVMRNETWLSPAISKHVVSDYIRRVSAEGTPLDLLTQRQREILQLIAEGHSTREIAHLLRISIKTVESHRADLMQRLDIHDLAGLTRYAIRTGLISSEE
ncbi:MAG TPA: response regulator transcription factor [Blastocatellia bacterium]|nr:response regulator transcription factor [Blastocatellia bacterium]